VKSYLFNSHIVSLPDCTMAIIAPSECADLPAAHDALQRLVEANDVPVSAVHYLDVRESMRNGGGPACLRLRVPMSRAQWEQVPEAFRFTPTREAVVRDWITHHYRDQLRAEDLRDPDFAIETTRICHDLHA